MTERPPPGPAAAQPAPAGRTGVVFCRCGPCLGSVVQLGELADPARWPGAADVAAHDVLCSPEGQAFLRARIEQGGLERVVVAACSPREHGATFEGVMRAAGRSPQLVQLVNLREQVEWIGGAPGVATARAGALMRAGLARVALHRPIAPREVEVSADVVVVGGGAAGVSAALALARKDRRVVLVERSAALGGLAARLDEIFPDRACASCFMEPALDAVLHHERIEVLTRAEVARVRGSAGRFEVELALSPRQVDAAACIGCDACIAPCPVELPDPWAAGLGRRRAIGYAYRGCLPHVPAVEAAACLRHAGGACDACQAGCPFGAIRLDAAPERRTVTAGAIVVATGLEPGAVAGPPGVVSSWQLERMLHPEGPTGGALRGAGEAPPRSVLLASAAGDEEGQLPARELLKLARLLRTRHPAVEVTVAGGLGRTPGLSAEARALEGDGVELLDAALLPGSPAAAGAAVAVRLAQGGLEVVRAFDLVAVHAPAEAPDAARELARLLRLPVDGRGFAEEGVASPFEPTATRVAGVFVAGAAAGARPIREAIRDGAAAAGRVLATLVPGERQLLEPLAAAVDQAICGGCGVCVASCPYGAIARDPLVGKARVEPAHCHGCGTCAAACPTGAMVQPHYGRAEIAAEISALLARAG